MNYVEYGKENSDVIILLHGGGLSWWNYKEVAERLQTDYHVVLPEYSCAAEPPVQCSVSHLSRRSEPQ